MRTDPSFSFLLAPPQEESVSSQILGPRWEALDRLYADPSLSESQRIAVLDAKQVRAQFGLLSGHSCWCLRRAIEAAAPLSMN